MMRLGTLLAPPLAGIEYRCVPHHQRRFKSFVHKIDKTNQHYFEVTKRDIRSQDGEPKAISEFFEMPDLLLDLDAEDSPNVRTVEDTDEDRMRTRWDVDHRRMAVRARLKAFEKELSDSRTQFESLVSKRANEWLPSHFDVLSTALLGSPQSIEHPIAVVQNDDQKQRLAFLGEIGVKNGIPSHAAKQDMLFLEWLMLRRATFRRRPGTAETITETLRSTRSIQEIRRIVFSTLTADLTTLPAFAGYLGFGASERTVSIPHEIRDACLRVCADSPDKPAAYAEVLSFLGNLSERLSANEARLGSTLHGLALRISAEAGLPAVSSLWIHRGYVNNVWMSGNEVAEDLSVTLDAFLKSLANAQGTGLHQAPHQRQFLFQMISGLRDHNVLAPESLRTLSTMFLHEKNETPAEQAYAVYELYIKLLGRLGAIRTLWHEGDTPTHWAWKKLERENITRDVGGLLRSATLDALRVAVIPDEEVAYPDPSLGECVTQDYHSIGAQNPDAWLQLRDNSERKASDEDLETRLPRRSLPFDVWMAQIRDMAAETKNGRERRKRSNKGLRQPNT